jgi:hypothetical protein
VRRPQPTDRCPDARNVYFRLRGGALGRRRTSYTSRPLAVADLKPRPRALGRCAGCRWLASPHSGGGGFTLPEGEDDHSRHPCRSSAAGDREKYPLRYVDGDTWMADPVRRRPQPLANDFRCPRRCFSRVKGHVFERRRAWGSLVGGWLWPAPAADVGAGSRAPATARRYPPLPSLEGFVVPGGEGDHGNHGDRSPAAGDRENYPDPLPGCHCGDFGEGRARSPGGCKVMVGKSADTPVAVHSGRTVVDLGGTPAGLPGREILCAEGRRAVGPG